MNIILFDLDCNPQTLVYLSLGRVIAFSRTTKVCLLGWWVGGFFVGIFVCLFLLVFLKNYKHRVNPKQMMSTRSAKGLALRHRQQYQPRSVLLQ